MKKILSILLVMFFGISAVGCASYQKKEDKLLTICDNLYTYSTFFSIENTDTFYKDVSEGMIDRGFSPITKYDYRGRSFLRKFETDRKTYIIEVDINVVPKLNEDGILEKSPYVKFSMKKERSFFRNNSFNDYSLCAYYLDIVEKIVVAASIDKRRN